MLVNAFPYFKEHDRHPHIEQFNCNLVRFLTAAFFHSIAKTLVQPIELQGAMVPRTHVTHPDVRMKNTTTLRHIVCHTTSSYHIGQERK